MHNFKARLFIRIIEKGNPAQKRKVRTPAIRHSQMNIFAD